MGKGSDGAIRDKFRCIMQMALFDNTRGNGMVKQRVSVLHQSRLQSKCNSIKSHFLLPSQNIIYRVYLSRFVCLSVFEMGNRG